MKDIPKAVEDAEDRHQRLTALDRAHVWHPFTQMQTWLEPLPGDEPVIIDHASGSWLFDTRGRKYLDAISSLWVNVHGHHRAEIDSAIRLQLELVAHAEGYHGDTLGSVSVGGMDLFHEIFRPLLFECLRVPAPYAYRWPTGPKHCLEAAALAAESMIHGRRDEIAAMVLEPLVMGAAGMITHPPGYLKRIARACKENGVLLICDEVATGFGRTGTLFACEQEEVVPDFLCLAKGLTGGYLPLAATLTTDAVCERFLGPFESKRTFFHGHSYTGNPLACAAALASLRLFDEDLTLDHARAMGERLAEGLASVAELKHVGDVRQRGLMIGIELVKDRKTKEEFSYADRMGHKVALAARRREVMLRPLGNVVVLMPPLSIKPSEVDFLVDGVRESIREATE